MSSLSAHTPSGTEKIRPLEGGYQIKPQDGIDGGTIGCFVYKEDGASISIYILTNYHVLYQPWVKLDYGVGQPKFSCCGCNNIAKITDLFEYNEFYDYALAEVDSQYVESNTIRQIGKINGLAAVAKDMRIKMVGSMTDLIHGTITDLSGEISTKDKKKTYYKQVIIKWDDKFPVDGDSGSVVLDNDNNVVALYWGSELETNRGAAQPVTSILARLDAKLLTNDVLEQYRRNPDRFSTKEFDWDELLTDYTKQLSGIPLGRKFVSVIQQHISECLSVAHRSRRVRYTLEKMKYGDFVRINESSAKDPGTPFVKKLGDVDAKEMIVAVLRAIQKETKDKETAKAIANHLTVLDEYYECDNIVSAITLLILSSLYQIIPRVLNEILRSAGTIQFPDIRLPKNPSAWETRLALTKIKLVGLNHANTESERKDKSRNIIQYTIKVPEIQLSGAATIRPFNSFDVSGVFEITIGNLDIGAEIKCDLESNPPRSEHVTLASNYASLSIKFSEFPSVVNWIVNSIANDFAKKFGPIIRQAVDRILEPYVQQRINDTIGVFWKKALEDARLLNGNGGHVHHGS